MRTPLAFAIVACLPLTACSSETTGGSTGANAGPKPDVEWQHFIDPAEKAFSVDVPAGWTVSGGSRRVSPVDIRTSVTAQSPDGAITIFLGDSEVPPFIEPNPALTTIGLREGMFYMARPGVQLMVQQYQDGETFATKRGAERVGVGCTNVTRTTSGARSDLSQALDLAYAAGGIRTSILVGEASFSCTMKGAPGAGYAFAATERAEGPSSAVWGLKVLAGFVADGSRAAGASGVLMHAVSSFVLDHEWQARQDQANRDFDRVVTQQNAIVSQAIIANGRALSAATDRLIQSGQQRSRDTMSAIDKYNEYAVRGTSDYVNPSTGTRYGSLDNSYTHTYVSSDQRILQTDSERSPGAGWTEIKAAKAGGR